MRSSCVVLLLVCAALASADPISAENKRLLGLDLGGLVGGLVCTVNHIVNGLLGDVLKLLQGVLGQLQAFLTGGVLPAIFGECGILGYVLNFVFEIELVINILTYPLFSCLSVIIDNVVSSVAVFVFNALDILLCALEGVVLTSVEAVYAVLYPLPSYVVCIAYYLVPECRPACNQICNCGPVGW